MAVLVVDRPGLRAFAKELTKNLSLSAQEELSNWLIPYWEKEVAKRTGPSHFMPVDDEMYATTLQVLHQNTQENIIVLTAPSGLGCLYIASDVYTPAPDIFGVESWTLAAAKRIYGTDPRWLKEYFDCGDKILARKRYDKRWGFATTGRNQIIGINDLALQTPERLLNVAGSVYQSVVSRESLKAVCDYLSRRKRVSFDTETTGLKPVDDKLVGISLSAEPGRAYYIPVGHNQGDQLALDVVMAALKPVFENDDIEIIGHKVNFDVNFIECNSDIIVTNIAGDTKTLAWMLGWPVLAVNKAAATGLKTIAKRVLNIDMMDFDTATSGRGGAAGTPIDKMTGYACADADMPLRLEPVLVEMLPEVMQRRYYEMELPFLSVVSHMERAGVYVNPDKLKQLDTEYRNEAWGILEMIRAIVHNEKFNPNSPMQVSKLLFDELRLPPTRKTKTGYSTDSESLEKLEGMHPIVDMLIDLRGVEKLIGTYSSGIPEWISKVTGRVHSSLAATGTASGRIASSKPNMMNIPVRTERGAKLRYVIEGQGDNDLLGIDYSQIEPRVMAHMSEEQFLITLFIDGIDLYRGIGAKMWNKDIDDITKQERGALKMFWLAATYLVGNAKLAKQMTNFLKKRVTPDEAGEYLALFYKTVPRVREFQQYLIEFAIKNGYAETLLGFRIPVPGITSQVPEIKAHGMSQAVNLPVQGTASGDILKKAMLALDPLVMDGTIPPMILQIHDELIFEGSREWLEESAGKIQSIMENIIELRVPIVAEPTVAKSWGEAKN